MSMLCQFVHFRKVFYDFMRRIQDIGFIKHLYVVLNLAQDG